MLSRSKEEKKMSDSLESRLEKSNADVWWYYGWIVTVIGVVWFLSFLWVSRNQPSPTRVHSEHHTGTCKSENCARCQVLVSSDFTQTVQHRCKAFFDTFECSPETRADVDSLVRDSVACKNEILVKVYEESGYEVRSQEENLPLIWMLPGLERRPFWGVNHQSLHSVVSIFDNSDAFQAIKKEFTHADRLRKGWKTNSVPTGMWSVFSLLNQGMWMEENATQCPATAELLKSLPSFMEGHVFGNAMFSVLEPGSSIEPHTGPCNYRLRCHLPLVTPPGFRIKVGREMAAWKEGKLLVFDDSFVHEVWQEEEEGVERGCGQGRVVFIFDIWHPQVTSEQQAAIQHIYTTR